MARKKRIETVPIKSLGDLVELVNNNTYVFDKVARKLGKKSHRMGFICGIAVIAATYAVSECRRLDDELYRLKVRLDKMEYKEGE